VALLANSFVGPWCADRHRNGSIEQIGEAHDTGDQRANARFQQDHLRLHIALGKVSPYLGCLAEADPQVLFIALRMVQLGPMASDTVRILP
jgi:hypothetical protein